MSIRLILFFPIVSNYCQVMQLTNVQNQLLFFVIDDMITVTQEKIQKLLFIIFFFFFGWGGGGGWGGEGRGDKLPKFSY